MTVTDGKKHELTVAKSDILIVPDSIYCFDKGYIDYAWFRRISDVGAFFVCRAKDNMVLRFVGQHETPKTGGVIFDDVVEMGGQLARQRVIPGSASNRLL